MQQGARKVSRDKLSQQAGLRNKPTTCESKEEGSESRVIRSHKAHV